ncbi:MAG TPA: cyclophilin-like fold protein [Methylomirabilota bacterium]
MPRAIKITAGGVSATGELNDSRAAAAIAAKLPITAKAETWGDEIYFGLPFSAPSDAPQDTVALGDLGYWPPGKAFCIFFGRTPVSQGDEIRPASPVTVVGRISGDVGAFKKVRAGTGVTIEAV